MGASNTMWTAERVQYLRDNYKTQFTGDIAKALGDVFTRNAIIGKARRLGLSADFRLQPYRQRTGKLVKKEAKLKPRVRKPMEEIRIKRLRKPVSIVELESWHCREIVQDNPVRYCGKQKADGSSYCAEHHRKNHHHVQHSKVEKYYGL